MSPSDPHVDPDRQFIEDELEADDPPWDADDERRQKDCFAPPEEPCECECIHCGRTFMSDQIWFQRVIGSKDGFEGFWMCPTPNCDGAGFTFDIFPTDPNHPANEGWVYYDEDDICDESDEEDRDYDPGESKYKQLDEEFGDEDDDIEGEEWKYGLRSGDESPPPEMSEAQKQWEEQQKMYDQPDQRPRVVDWSNREPPAPMGEDEIPF